MRLYMWRNNRYNHSRAGGWLYFVLCLCVCSVSGCISDDEGEDAAGGVEAGMEVPDFSVTMNDGRIVDKESLRGKPSCIVFFNTSCGDCRNELPVLERVYGKYGTAGYVNFVLVSREQDKESVGMYWTENGFTMPYSAQADRTVYCLFASSGIPRIYISDADLQVRTVFTDSPLATEKDLIAAIQSLLP